MNSSFEFQNGLYRWFVCVFLLITWTQIKTHELPTVADEIDQVMRGIGIQYLISDDRKLPKKDRQKWETDLAQWIDFKSLNEGMRNRINTAVGLAQPKDFDAETTELLADKAVLFLVPRELADYTRLYLKQKHEIGQLPDCNKLDQPDTAPQLITCTQSVTNQEMHVVFMDNQHTEHSRLVFKQDNNWKLVNIAGEIPERTLLTVARWK